MRDRTLWIMTITIGLAVWLIFGCGTERPPLVTGAQLTGPNTVRLTMPEGNQTVRFGDVHDRLAKMNVPRPRARELLHSIDQQKQAWNRAKRECKQGPTKEAVLWLARAVHSETKRSTEMELVAAVIVNRIESPRYPDTARQVVQEAWQFTAIHKGTARSLGLSMKDYPGGPNAWRRAVRIAHGALSLPKEMRPLRGVTHFYSPRSMQGKPEWAHRQPRYRIGNRFAFYDLSGG